MLSLFNKFSHCNSNLFAKYLFLHNSHGKFLLLNIFFYFKYDDEKKMGVVFIVIYLNGVLCLQEIKGITSLCMFAFAYCIFCVISFFAFLWNDLDEILLNKGFFLWYLYYLLALRENMDRLHGKICWLSLAFLSKWTFFLFLHF